MGPERIELSATERERFKVLQQVEEGHLKQIQAARRLRLTDRQVRRLQVRGPLWASHRQTQIRSA